MSVVETYCNPTKLRRVSREPAVYGFTCPNLSHQARTVCHVPPEKLTPPPPAPEEAEEERYGGGAQPETDLR